MESVSITEYYQKAKYYTTFKDIYDDFKTIT